MPLRLMSLNAWGGRLHDVLLPYLAGAEADVLCLQEVTDTPGVDAGWLTYRDGELELLQRANLFDEIAAVLPDHRGFFYPAAKGPLAHGNGKVLASFGLATFVRKTLPIIGQSLDFIHGAFSPNGWGQHPRSRNAHAIRLFEQNGAKTMTIVQLHGLRDPEGKGDTSARIAQALALRQFIESIWRRNEPLIVCGDLNVLPASETFDVLGELGLVDLVTTRGHTDTRTSYYMKPGRYADYMLVTPSVSVAGFEVVVSPEASDHRALVLQVA